MIKTHDKDFFFKYTTAATAQIVLRTLTVRWSSPAVFNDPFDTQLDLRSGFEPDEFPAPMATAIEQLVFADDDPPREVPYPLGPALCGLRLVRHRLNREEYAQQSHEALQTGMRNMTAMMRAHQEAWPTYVRTMRVFCVAEERDNLLMWSHYADQHTGVVLKLKCIPEQDTAPCAAKAITYRTDLPVMASLDDYVRHCTGERRLSFDNVFFDLAFTKSAHWSYEREWRCWVLARPGEEHQLYEDNLLDPEEIDGLYLGCRIGREDRDAVLGLLDARLAHVKVFQAHMARRRFALDFERIR